jgi:hypothetical protein
MEFSHYSETPRNISDEVIASFETSWSTSWFWSWSR